MQWIACYSALENVGLTNLPSVTAVTDKGPVLVISGGAPGALFHRVQDDMLFRDKIGSLLVVNEVGFILGRRLPLRSLTSRK